MMNESLYLYCQKELIKIGFKRSFDPHYYQLFLMISGGNVGSIEVLIEIAKKAPNEIFFEEITTLLRSYGAVRERLWVLYKDVCNKDSDKLYYFINLFINKKIDPLTFNYVVVDIPETYKYRMIILEDIFKNYVEKKKDEKE